MADTPGQAEPRAAGRRYMALDGEDPPETPRFSLDGIDLERYIPQPTKESSDKAREASIKVTELPHVIHKERVAVIAALKAQGYTRKDLAEAMGMKPSGIDWCLREARKRGILTAGMEFAAKEIDEEAIPRAAEVIIEALKDGNVDVALRLAHGRGLLRTYTNNKNDGPAGPGGPSMAFQFNFVMPDGSPSPDSSALAGKILGNGKP